MLSSCAEAPCAVCGAGAGTDRGAGGGIGRVAQAAAKAAAIHGARMAADPAAAGRVRQAPAAASGLEYRPRDGPLARVRLPDQPALDRAAPVGGGGRAG